MDDRSLAAYILAILCIVVEVISLISKIVFVAVFDESDTELIGWAILLTVMGLLGRLFACCFVIWATTPGESECGFTLLCISIGILSIPCIGIYQLAAGILMAVVTALNSAANVQAFGGFIVSLDLIVSILSAVYGCLACCVVWGGDES